MKHMTTLHLLLTIMIKSLPGLAIGGYWLSARKCHQTCITDLQMNTGIESVVTVSPYHPECSTIPPTLDCAQSYLFYVDYDEDVDKSVILSKGMMRSALSWSSLQDTNKQGERAFDGDIVSHFHSQSEQEPWLKGDLGSIYTIIGAFYTNRNNFEHRGDDLHFLVAVTDEDLDDYSSSLCYFYPGPPMSKSQVEWFPCQPPRAGRFFKVMRILDHENVLQIAELDVYGYLM